METNFFSVKNIGTQFPVYLFLIIFICLLLYSLSITQSLGTNKAQTHFRLLIDEKIDNRAKAWSLFACWFDWLNLVFYFATQSRHLLFNLYK